MKHILTIATILILSLSQIATAQKKPIKKDFNPTIFIANTMIEALQKNDTNIILLKLVPNQADFDKLFTAIYTETPEIAKLMNTVDARKLITSKLIEGFKNTIAEGTKQGIDWKTIKMTWNGGSAQEKKASTSFSVPIHFKANGKEYRIGIDFCNWLNADPNVFVLGEIKWEGLVQK